MRVLLIVLSVLFFAPTSAFAVVAPTDTAQVSKASDRTEWRGVVGGIGTGFSLAALFVLGTPLAVVFGGIGTVVLCIYLIWYLVDSSPK